MPKMRNVRIAVLGVALTAIAISGGIFVVRTCAASGLAASAPLAADFAVFPADNVWNTPVDLAPLHPRSAYWMQAINGHTGHPLHADFGHVYRGHLNGIPYNLVDANTPREKVAFDPARNYAGESDALPSDGLPIPADAVVEGDPQSEKGGGDRHLILVDTSARVLHELFDAVRQPDGSWQCAQYSRWDLTSNALRADDATSADAAGLPIFPGLVRWDEIERGEIRHALRFTLDLTWKQHLWPARHDAPVGGSNNPPMGMRVRLKSGFDISGYSATNQVILTALKRYGMMLADNGGDWFISGAPNPRFDDDDLHRLGQIVPGDAFEVVDTSAWIVDADSGRVAEAATSR